MTSWLEKISPCLRNVGSAGHPAGWVEPQRFIHDHQLVLFAKGDFDVEFPLNTLEGFEGTFLIIPPGLCHVTRMRSRRGRRCWIHFDWIYPDSKKPRPLISYPPAAVDSAEIFPAPNFVPQTILHGPVLSFAAVLLHGQIESSWNSGQLREQLLCRGLLLQLLVELLGPAPSETAKTQPQSSHLAQQIRTQLDQLARNAIDEMPSIQKELESLGCSYAHACRVFHAAYGLSPLAYTHRLRMEQAKLLLREGTRSITDVGRAVGIQNPAYFSRLFRNIVGQSPRQYAKRLSQEASDTGGFKSEHRR